MYRRDGNPMSTRGKGAGDSFRTRKTIQQCKFRQRERELISLLYDDPEFDGTVGFKRNIWMDYY